VLPGACGHLCSQSFQLTGRITDPQGRIVLGVAVHLRSVGADVGLARTDPEGRFRFQGLPPGNYRLSAEAPGFVSVSRDVNFPATQSTETFRSYRFRRKYRAE
jgi:hypothetical protein